MRRYRTMPINKTISITFLTLLLALAITGYSYSHWTETIHIQGTITTGTWNIASVRIMKTLNGSFTNATTGEDITTPTNLIHVADANNPGWPTKFQLIITVENNGTLPITDAVYDVIENNVEPINATPSKGTVNWYYNHTTGGEFVQNFLNWTIGTLNPGEVATLEIWIQTLHNPAEKYEPTSENQTLEINRGANITATANLTSGLVTLFARTEAITLTIVDD
ncbi:MAG: hypothetical protein ACPLW8_04285, partial [Candidatus Bathyarchaeales archaeon]